MKFSFKNSTLTPRAGRACLVFRFCRCNIIQYCTNVRNSMDSTNEKGLKRQNIECRSSKFSVKKADDNAKRHDQVLLHIQHTSWIEKLRILSSESWMPLNESPQSQESLKVSAVASLDKPTTEKLMITKERVRYHWICKPKYRPEQEEEGDAVPKILPPSPWSHLWYSFQWWWCWHLWQRLRRRRRRRRRPCGVRKQYPYRQVHLEEGGFNMTRFILCKCTRRKHHK